MFTEKFLEVLKHQLVKIDGFIRSERFSSLVNERKILSLSVWEDGDAVSKWRNIVEHRMAQQQGRDSIFESYTITVVSSLRSYTDKERAEAPNDSNTFFQQAR
ncbi:antibiotic biosynthesis monooxygenase family protein [Clostridium botulinum]|uniref:antibiotic biosynthesis monooxygenase family protein n=1 Tax=Clostridium botulinum TaxID=1491 RepID=UPI00016B9899|nr:antibiotic biosynthesis monooxygenase [Clostridium botulinum]APC79205.1 antibiotic biosynthesis monooxygenase family protein [Clostridium botulinum]APC85319.1 antibiotic biosynthesis monooxygenase family protein [Clostridium botulinum]AXG95997.1 antibiotic biosynthesis monooxygenase [Clostridium botulinum]MBY6772054.1 antibiotic biosynthesis monooxygenase [Clostridium botulinum]MBY6774089.1 antibiotic biosynthesis monooxygenase [Clostridium botulinum]